MKATLGKKYITITPKPTKDIPDGLGIEYGTETQTLRVKATTDIIKGKSRYTRPTFTEAEGRKIIKTYINI